MSTTDKRKRSLYFPDTILREMQSEAKRQERSLSWIVQYAWRIAREELMRLPSVGEPTYGLSSDHGVELNDEVDVGPQHRDADYPAGSHLSHHGS